MASEVAAVVAAAPGPGVRPSEAERAALQMLRAARSLSEAQLLPVAARQLSVPAHGAGRGDGRAL